jgi:hypothetical protein
MDSTYSLIDCIFPGFFSSKARFGLDNNWIIVNKCVTDSIRHCLPAVLKGLSHEIDFKTFDKNLQNLVYITK